MSRRDRNMKIARLFMTCMLMVLSMLMAYASGLMSYMFYTGELNKTDQVFKLTALLVITLEVAKYLTATFKFVFNGRKKHVVNMLLNILLLLSIVASVNYFMVSTEGYNPAGDFVKLMAGYAPIERIARHLTLILNISLSIVIETLVIKLPQLIPNIWGKHQEAYKPFWSRVTGKMLTYYANKVESWVDKKVGTINPSMLEPANNKPDVNMDVNPSKQDVNPSMLEPANNKPDVNMDVNPSKQDVNPSMLEPANNKPDVNMEEILTYISTFKGNILPTGKLVKKFGLTRSKWERIREELKAQGIVRPNKTKLEVI
jgi:hypothetical protein